MTDTPINPRPSGSGTCPICRSRTIEVSTGGPVGITICAGTGEDPDCMWSVSWRTGKEYS